MNACCFFGHRKITETSGLVEKITKEVEKLINEKGVSIFYFGSKSQFDSLCLNVVTDLKKKYTYLKRIYVRAAFPDISNSYEKYLLESYEQTYFPPKIQGAGKAAYVKRNEEMIDKSAFCVIYYNQNYLPPRQKTGNGDLRDYQPKSGTQIAYNYAMKKGKEIINVF